MAISASSGLFGSLSSNLSKLNSRKSKDFLWNESPRRFKNNRLKPKMGTIPEGQRERFFNRVKEMQAGDRQTEYFTLAISVLLGLLLFTTIL